MKSSTRFFAQLQSFLFHIDLRVYYYDILANEFRNALKLDEYEINNKAKYNLFESRFYCKYCKWGVHWYTLGETLIPSDNLAFLGLLTRFLFYGYYKD